jgi:hypothetical protein
MSFVNFNFVTDKSSMPGVSTVNTATFGNPGTVTILGLSILIIYTLTKILNFYGISINVYGSYLAFYIFILMASFCLNRYYPKF